MDSVFPGAPWVMVYVVHDETDPGPVTPIKAWRCDSIASWEERPLQEKEVLGTELGDLVVYGVHAFTDRTDASMAALKLRASKIEKLKAELERWKKWRVFSEEPHSNSD